MSAAVDFHCHILPGVDDGSANVEESLAMLRLEAEQGVACVVATPHFYPWRDDPKEFLERRQRAENVLRAEMAKQSDLPELIVGTEVHFFRNMSESESLRQLTIGCGNFIMIEMPASPWPEEAWRELKAIREKQGLIPVIAHVDRYIAPLRTHKMPQRLEELPVLVQANAEFFLRRTTAGMALRMLKKGQIHLLGSDCHDLSDRKPNLGSARRYIEKKVQEDVLKEIGRWEDFVLGAALCRKGAE